MGAASVFGLLDRIPLFNEDWESDLAPLFDHVFNFGGSDTSFPLFVFVFLVALGIGSQPIPGHAV